jgi:hypothetical protein
MEKLYNETKEYTDPISFAHACIYLDCEFVYVHDSLSRHMSVFKFNLPLIPFVVFFISAFITNKKRGC